MTIENKNDNIPHINLHVRGSSRFICVNYNGVSDTFLIDELKFLTDGTYYINNAINKLTATVIKRYDDGKENN